MPFCSAYATLCRRASSCLLSPGTVQQGEGIPPRGNLQWRKVMLVLAVQLVSRKKPLSQRTGKEESLVGRGGRNWRDWRNPLGDDHAPRMDDGVSLTLNTQYYNVWCMSITFHMFKSVIHTVICTTHYYWSSIATISVYSVYTRALLSPAVIACACPLLWGRRPDGRWCCLGQDPLSTSSSSQHTLLDPCWWWWRGRWEIWGQRCCCAPQQYHQG